MQCWRKVSTMGVYKKDKDGQVVLLRVGRPSDQICILQKILRGPIHALSLYYIIIWPCSKNPLRDIRQHGASVAGDRFFFKGDGERHGAPPWGHHGPILRMNFCSNKMITTHAWILHKLWGLILNAVTGSRHTQ